MINLFKRHKIMIVLIVGLFIIIGGLWWQRELVKQYDGLVMAIVTTILIATTMYYSWLTKEIMETYNTPNIKITIEPFPYAHITAESTDTWNKGKLEGNLHTIAIENIGTGAAKEIKITKDPFPGLKLNEAFQNSTIYPKQRYELIMSKEDIEKKAINGFIEYKISYKSPTNKEIKGSFKISITAINLTPVPTLGYDITLISKGILAIAGQYTGRNIQQEIKKASEGIGNILNNKE